MPTLHELTDWNRAELMSVDDLPPDFAFAGVQVSSPSGTPALWRPQLYSTPEGYIGTLNLTSDPLPDGAAPPTKEVANSPRFDVTVDASPQNHEIVTTCRTRSQYAAAKPVGYVAIQSRRSIDVAATQSLPADIEVSLHLSDMLGERQQSITSLRVDMLGETPGAFTLFARGGSGIFDEVRISGEGVERQLRDRGVDVHPIGNSLSALRSHQDKAQLIDGLSDLLAVDLSLPLDRHATAVRLYETMGRADFSVLGAIVQAHGAEYDTSAQITSRSRKLQSLLRRLPK